MKIRKPHDRLAGCVWLPRIVDKTRHFLNSTLDQDYQRSFCHPRGIDGYFFNHFGISKEEIIEAVAEKETDNKMAAWFLSDSSREEKIDAWNQFATRLGLPGFEGEEMVRWALENVYTDCKDPRADTAFKILAYDEGYLESLEA
jgi:hypothetical protein